MAFALEAIVNNVVYSLSDKNPFRLGNATGLSMAANHRLLERSPRQDGDTDLGYRLDPRTITLQLHFYASTPAELDTHRDTLINIFRPVRGYDIKLRVTRDDGGVRQIDCQTIGQLNIRLMREERAGNLHRVVVQLRAANPIWYDPAIAHESLSVTVPWWQGSAGTIIPYVNALDFVSFPLPARTVAGSVAYGNPWTIVYHGALVGFVGTRYICAFGTANNDVSLHSTGWDPPISSMTFGLPEPAGALIVNPLTDSSSPHWHFFVSNGGTVISHNESGPNGTAVTTGAPLGPPRKWLSDFEGNNTWQTSISIVPHVALYDIALSDAQMSAMRASGTIENAIAYEGDFSDRPVISLTGPITSPVITNKETGNAISMAGATVPANEIWTIDLRESQPHVYDMHGTDYTSSATGLDDWQLEPAPVATGGTNTIIITGGSVDDNTTATITYYNRYASY